MGTPKQTSPRKAPAASSKNVIFGIKEAVEHSSSSDSFKTEIQDEIVDEVDEEGEINTSEDSVSLQSRAVM